MDPSLTSEKTRRDHQLVEAACTQGDQQAYADLMFYYKEPIYNMLLRMTHNPTDADDLTMDVFGKAFRQLPNYTPRAPFSYWLFTIASNVGLDHLRHKKHLELVSLTEISESGENEEEMEMPIPSDDPSPEEEMISSQRVQLMRKVVQQLQPRYRSILEMRYYEDLSYEEIANRMGVPLGTVKTQINRAHALLASLMHRHRGTI